MVDVDCARNAWDGVQLANVVLQVGHLMDEVAVALEVHLRQQQGLGSCLQYDPTAYGTASAIAVQQNATGNESGTAVRLPLLV